MTERRARFAFLVLAPAVLGLAACAEGQDPPPSEQGCEEAVEALTLGGFVEGERVLLSGCTYRLVDQLEVKPGALLRIQAGVRIEVEPDRGEPDDRRAPLVVGRNGESTLEVQGTAESPVVLASAAADPRPGDHAGILLYEGANATLRHLHVLHAGGRTLESGQEEAALWIAAPGTILEDSVFSSSRGGVRTATGLDASTPLFASFARNTFVDVPAGAVRAEAGFLADLGEGHCFTDEAGRAGCAAPADPVAAGAFIVVDGADVTRSGVWKDHGVPYRFVGGGATTHVRAGAEVEIEDGAELRFGQGKVLLVGGADDGGGTLRAVASSPGGIRFVGEVEDWGSITFEERASSSSILDGVEVQGGGTRSVQQEPGAVTIYRSQPTIRNSRISGALGYGISYACSEAGGPSLENNTFADNQAGDVFESAGCP